jgi:protein-S-isoprenylcysteine O-methyltransferase Ste14
VGARAEGATRDRVKSQSVGDSSPAPADVPAPWVQVALDVFERAFVVLLFGFLAWSVFAAVGKGATWLNFVQLASEALNAAFILLRTRASVVSYRPTDWLVSIGATTGSLLVRPGDVPPLTPIAFAGALIMLGLACQIWSKLTLRRSFGMAPANRGLKVKGPYRYVRHPMYLGYLTGWIGFFLLNPTPWNACVYAVSIFFQWRRIEAEERVLALDPAHAAYRAETPYRVIPAVW